MEREDGVEGGCVLWHVGIPVVQHVRTRQGLVEFFRATPRAFRLSMPSLGVPFLTQTIRRACEQKDE